MSKKGQKPGRFRKTPSRKRETRKRILVMCEGKVTEPEYFDGLKDDAKNPLVTVRSVPVGGEPKKVVDAAIHAKTISDRNRKNPDKNTYDEIWAVFDRDDHARFRDALDRAKQSGVLCAPSIPCFELWLLLHFQDQNASLDRSQAKRLLRKHVPDYDKHVDFVLFSKGIDDACGRAAQLRSVRSDRQAERNPSTDVDLLVERIRGNMW